MGPEVQRKQLADSVLAACFPHTSPRMSSTKPVEMHTLIIKTVFSNCGKPQPRFPIRTRWTFHLWQGAGWVWGQTSYRASRPAASKRRTLGVPGIFSFLKANKWRLEPWVSGGLWGVSVMAGLRLEWIMTFFLIEQNADSNLLVSQVEMVSSSLSSSLSLCCSKSQWGRSVSFLFSESEICTF